MVACAMAVPANNAPTSDDVIAHRSVLIVRVLFMKREVDVSTEVFRVSFAAGRLDIWVGLRPFRAKLISVTIATNRDSEKSGLNRKSPKSATNRAKGAGDDKLCRVHRMSGSSFLVNCPPADLKIRTNPTS